MLRCLINLLMVIPLAACYALPAEGPPPASPTPPPIPTALPTGSPTPAPTASPAPSFTPPPTAPPAPSPTPANRRVIGQSVEGRPIVAVDYGTGDRPLLLIGGLHGGYEANTVRLMEAFIAHFEASPPPAALTIIPDANPDGTAASRDLAGRFNANGVDLNRNWSCNWSATAYHLDAQVDPGPQPFSERETRALRDVITADPPAAVIFYHSAEGAIYSGACGGFAPSRQLATTLAEATGYRSGQGFSDYPVTGEGSNWVAAQNIPAVVIELTTREDIEFERNLRGVEAVLCAISGGC